MKCKGCGNAFGNEIFKGLCAICYMEKNEEEEEIKDEAFRREMEEINKLEPKKLSFLEQKTKSYLSQWGWIAKKYEEEEE